MNNLEEDSVQGCNPFLATSYYFPFPLPPNQRVSGILRGGKGDSGVCKYFCILFVFGNNEFFILIQHPIEPRAQQIDMQEDGWMAW